jgi:HEAT repeat protein
MQQVPKTRRSRSIWLGVSVLSASVASATVIYFTHPDDPHDEGLLVGMAAFLWPFLAFPVAWFTCVTFGVLDYRRGLRRPALVGVLLATLAGPTIFSGYVLNQKPWLSPAAKLKDPWPDVRAHGAWLLGAKAQPEGIPLLIAALSDPQRDVRSSAADALAHYGPRAASAIPAIVAVLDDKDWFVGCEAGEALGAMRGLHEVVLPPLLAHLSTGKETQRWCAAKAIRKLGPEAAPAVPILVKLLSYEDASVRAAACETMAAIGPASIVAVPELTRALKDPNQWVRKAAHEALTKIQGSK